MPEGYTMNRKTIQALIENVHTDPDLLEAVQDALLSFEDYHRSIYSMEIRKRLLFPDAPQHRDEIMAMDQNRTLNHNSVLANVRMLNRMAQMAGLPPVYDGIVSEEQPFRREVADAVLAFVQEIILERP